jgi:hypothetical protein
MTYFPDLTPYRYGFGPLAWGADGPRALEVEGLYGWMWGPDGAFDVSEVAVGWLEPLHKYPRGRMAPDLVEKLERLCRASRYHMTRGFHPCGFCDESEEGFGSKEIRLAGDDMVYAAPNLIAHYVRAHEYAPPPGFVDALRRRDALAEPKHDVGRPVLLEMIPRDDVEPAALEAAVRADHQAEHRSRVFPELSITGHGNGLEIAAHVDLRPYGDLLRRSWNLPAIAFLNMEQATLGVRSMLERVYSEHMEALAPWKRAPG